MIYLPAFTIKKRYRHQLDYETKCRYVNIPLRGSYGNGWATGNVRTTIRGGPISSRGRLLADKKPEYFFWPASGIVFQDRTYLSII